MSTRVVVADDIADFRWLLRAALNADGRFDVVGEAADGREAVDIVDLTHPDVVVLDLRMPVMDGLEAVAQIVEVSPETRIVIHSAVAERCVASALGVSAVVGYLKKGSSARVIVEAVAQAANG